MDALTRWAILLYTTLPASYLAPSLGRKQEDYTMASGVCSVLTIPALIVFCIIAVIVSQNKARRNFRRAFAVQSSQSMRSSRSRKMLVMSR